MKKIFSVILVLFALTACATDVTVTSPVAVPPTSTPRPTETPLPPPATAIPIPIEIPVSLPALPPEAVAWVAAHPEFNLPGQLDASGFHVDLGGGKKIDVPPDQIAARIKVGQEGALQIYNEAGDKILAAFDPETNAWVDADKVIWKGKTQEDKLNAENYVRVQTWAQEKELHRLTKHFLLPFPENTHFPPLDKIFWDYENYDNPGDRKAEFNAYRPFGYLPAGAAPPFEFVNYIILEKNLEEGRKYDSIIYYEKIYNPADGSFSVLKFGPTDITDPVISFEYEFEYTKGNFISLPQHWIDKASFNNPTFTTILKYLRKNNLIDASGNMPQIKEFVRIWLTTGHVGDLENIFLVRVPKDFIQK